MLGLVCLAFILPASASEKTASKPQQTLPKWEIGLGPGLIDYPDYPGSKERNTLVLPFPYITYRGEHFQIDQREVKKPLFHVGKWELDISLAGSIPVSSKDNRLREGMDDLDAAVEFGPVARYSLWQDRLNTLQFELPVRSVIASDFRSIHQEGWVSAPGLFYAYRRQFTQSQRLKFSAGISANFATDSYHHYFYGVDAADTTPTRPAYEGKSGFSGLTYLLGLNWHLGDYWLGAFYKLNDLKGSVYEESPLVETTRAETFGLALTWNFYVSKETVKGLD
jgi:outer membrane protein